MPGKGKHVKKTETDKKKVIIIGAIAAAVIIAIVAGVVLSKTLKGIKKDDAPEDETVIDVEETDPVTDEPEETDPVEDEPEEDEPEDEPEDETEVYTGPVNPLTGLPVSEDISRNRPYAVMMNNIKTAVPQEGIASADIIYETLAEGGITRMVAVFQDISVVDKLGSIRSARPYFIDLAQAHDAIYIHAGGSSDAYTQLKARNITNIDGVNGSGETFYRDSWRKSNMGLEHSLMLDTTLLPAYVEKNSLRTTHSDGYECNMVFSDEAMTDGESGENVVVTFSSSKTTSMAYDAENGLYTLSQYGTTMTDSSDGSAVRVKNVIVLYASISKIPKDDAGRLQMTLTGTGNGYFIRDGKYIEITWSKDSYDSQFKYTAKDGSQVEFGRGSTYIAIIPIGDGKVKFS